LIGRVANFAPQTANICTLYGKSSGKSPGYAAEFPGFGEKTPELWLWRNVLDVPLPLAAFGRNFEIA
jgi:hypothetical protein